MSFLRFIWTVFLSVLACDLVVVASSERPRVRANCEEVLAAFVPPQPSQLVNYAGPPGDIALAITTWTNTYGALLRSQGEKDSNPFAFARMHWPNIVQWEHFLKARGLEIGVIPKAESFDSDGRVSDYINLVRRSAGSKSALFLFNVFSFEQHPYLSFVYGVYALAAAHLVAESLPILKYLFVEVMRDKGNLEALSEFAEDMGANPDDLIEEVVTEIYGNLAVYEFYKKMRVAHPWIRHQFLEDLYNEEFTSGSRAVIDFIHQKIEARLQAPPAVIDEIMEALAVGGFSNIWSLPVIPAFEAPAFDPAASPRIVIDLPDRALELSAIKIAHGYWIYRTSESGTQYVNGTVSVSRHRRLQNPLSAIGNHISRYGALSLNAKQRELDDRDVQRRVMDLCFDVELVDDDYGGVSGLKKTKIGIGDLTLDPSKRIYRGIARFPNGSFYSVRISRELVEHK